MAKDAYVYVLLDGLTPRYVGKGRGSRIDVSRRYRGEHLEARFLLVGLTHKVAHEMETRLIRDLTSRGVALLNHLPDGEKLSQWGRMGKRGKDRKRRKSRKAADARRRAAMPASSASTPASTLTSEYPK